MNLLTSLPHGIAATTEDSVLAERLEELQETNSRLQILVCELLVKNQQLRVQRADE
jgi:hypothetical protein